jgi:hypothetical protein
MATTDPIQAAAEAEAIEVGKLLLDMHDRFNEYVAAAARRAVVAGASETDGREVALSTATAIALALGLHYLVAQRRTMAENSIGQAMRLSALLVKASKEQLGVAWPGEVAGVSIELIPAASVAGATVQ